MSTNLKGKYLIKKTKNKEGEPCFVITGIFYPADFNIDEIEINEEMWVSEITINNGGLRFSEPTQGFAPSPEEFLSGECTSPSSWKTKHLLYI